MAHTQRKTILVFTTAYLPYQGGAEIAVDKITQRLTDFNFVVFTSRFSRRNPPREKHGNVIIIRLGVGSSLDKFFLPILSFLRGYIMFRKKKERISLWGVMISQGSIAAYFLKCLWPRVPLLITLQEGDSEAHIAQARFGLIQFFWRLILRKADQVQVISRYLKDKAIAYGFCGNVHIVPNGVDWKLFSNPQLPERIAELRARLGISKKAFILISVSRLVEKNGLGDIIKAIPQLDNDVMLLLVGDGPLRKTLQKQCEALQIKPRVLFLGDIPHKDIPLYLQCAHIFIRPSRSEGLGNAFLEAMAAGLPVVATPVGGIQDFLQNGETGLTVNINNSQDIVQAVNMLAKDETLYTRLQKNGQNMVKEKYQWESIADSMRDIFNEL